MEIKLDVEMLEEFRDNVENELHELEIQSLFTAESDRDFVPLEREIEALGDLEDNLSMLIFSMREVEQIRNKKTKVK